jgi:hypothetical protein
MRITMRLLVRVYSELLPANQAHKVSKPKDKAAKDRLTTKGIHDIVDSFLQEKIVYQDDYREPEALSPLADQNPSLFREERLRLPTALREKTPFFLRWYMSVKPEDLVRMRNSRVLPSFFQNIDDFTPRLYHIIQKSITPIQTYTNYPFLHDPLDSLPPLEKNRVYYYYNVKETPQKHPYILVLSASKTDLLRMANHYLVQGKNLQSKGSPIQSYWAKEGSSWVPTGTDPRAAIVPRASWNVPQSALDGLGFDGTRWKSHHTKNDR